MFIILHGDDEFSTSEQVERIRQGMGDPQFADLNTAKLDGRKVSLSELQHVCSSTPFLAEKRLVLVEGMLANLEPHRKKGSESGEREEADEGGEAGEDRTVMIEGLKQYLAQIPDSTQLVFVESKSLAKNNPILKLAEDNKGRAQIVEHRAPRESDLPHWIAGRANQKGAKITDEAIKALAGHIGPDLRLLDNEIDKLVLYRGKDGIRIEDVQILVASVHEANIFQFVDAIGARNAREAMELLHEHLNRNASPQYLLAMMTRQFRLLVQVKDLAARRLDANGIAMQLKAQSWMVLKLLRQAGNFTMPQLESIYRKLLEVDLAIKTGRSDPVVALDVLVVELTRR